MIVNVALNSTFELPITGNVPHPLNVYPVGTSYAGATICSLKSNGTVACSTPSILNTALYELIEKLPVIVTSSVILIGIPIQPLNVCPILVGASNGVTVDSNLYFCILFSSVSPSITYVNV